nr:AP2/ERF and B3 domain-containing transcription factor At1g50680-like [Tanacetum cinerariifolium]
MGISGPPETPPISIPDLNYGNNCHKVIDNCAYSQKYKGVVAQQNGHWGAQLHTNNQRIWLGTFKIEKDAAMAYDRASIKLRSYDSPKNFPWSQTTDLEAKFQSHLNIEVILKMIKDETYESKFNNFLREKTGKEKDDDLSVRKNCDNFRRLLFKKELTPSDVGNLNRLVIPKKFAMAYFPRVPDNDHSNRFVNDEVILPFYDVDSKLWKFRYSYCKSSRIFVFSRGWNRFVKEKKLTAKDKINFYYNEDLRSANSSYFEIGTSFPKSNIGASLKLGMETQVRYMESKEDEGIIEDREISDEVIQTSNVETKGFKLFGVQIMKS